MSSVQSFALNRAGTRLAIASNDLVRIWTLDRQPPPPTASWEDLMTYFRRQMRVCLSADDRKKYLGELTLVAEQKATDCQANLNR
ncbi:MAG TPA: hypothetical protein VNT29_11625 [Candidatus Limnocylindrales bacterium]|nr:hypothetical protein [Candidatus Limnocylindrales bacterium]